MNAHEPDPPTDWEDNLDGVISDTAELLSMIGVTSFSTAEGYFQLIPGGPDGPPWWTFVPEGETAGSRTGDTIIDALDRAIEEWHYQPSH
jgi:hypothetical protein